MTSLQTQIFGLNFIDERVIKLLFMLEERMKVYPQIDIDRKHYFAEGIYAREITVRAGALVIGKMHRHSQINVLSEGEISILTQDGWKRLKAPFTFESPAGTKRVGHAHTDTVWTTFISTKETDIDKMDDLLTIGSYQKYLEFKSEQLLLGGN